MHALSRITITLRPGKSPVNYYRPNTRHNKRLRVLLLSAIWLISGVQALFAQAGTINLADGPVQYVEPLNGTAPASSTSALAHSEAGSERSGNTIPAVGLPFGMTQFTPQTSWSENKCVAPYQYNARLFRGFRASHWLSGSCTQDYGSFSILPVVGKVSDTAGLVLDHGQELSTPYKYQIRFPGKYEAKMTATLRSGLWQLTMLKSDTLRLIIRANSDLNQGHVQIGQDSQSITGFNPVHRIYQGWGDYAGFDGNFYFVASQKPTSIRQKHAAAADSGVIVLSYYLRAGQTLFFKMGTSLTSTTAAKNNLDTEIPGWDFKITEQKVKADWNRHLGRIKVFTKSIHDLKMFYTSLYHSFQQPRLFSDAAGTYPAFSGGKNQEKSPIMQIKDGLYYDDFSMWDIYRAQLPLMMLIEPKTVNNFVRSILLKSEQGGWTPIFPCWNNYTAAMIGDHSTAFVAAAYQMGIRDFDLKALYPYLRKNAFDTTSQTAYRQGKGRRALKSYLRYGYIPLEDEVKDAFHKKEQVSRTLEYSYDDYALSVLAKALGKTSDYKHLSKRALNYKNVIDPSVAMARGRYQNGKWIQSFRPYERASYITEGTPAQYSFYVPQDIKGLAQWMGGDKILENHLDELFAKKGYWHGNEPGHQIPFMYNYTKSPYKTQLEVHKILQQAYSPGPGGIDGNDDAGQMSSWYVFASMGFYPVDPVSGTYMLSSPQFDHIEIQLSNHKMLSITTHKTTVSAIYIEKILLNGRLYTKNYLTKDLFKTGGDLQIYLTAHPTAWGSKQKDRGYSMSH